MKKTTQAVTIDFRNYGPITVPAGTAITNQTATGIDPLYNFVADLSFIDRDYKDIANILKHDAKYYGINIPAEFVTNA